MARIGLLTGIVVRGRGGRAYRDAFEVEVVLAGEGEWSQRGQWGPQVWRRRL